MASAHPEYRLLQVPGTVPLTLPKLLVDVNCPSAATVLGTIYTCIAVYDDVTVGLNSLLKGVELVHWSNMGTINTLPIGVGVDVDVLGNHSTLV